MSDTTSFGPRFLAARWQNLILANYPVPPELLQRRLPPGLELDHRDGQAWVSLVAFQFLDTRVLRVSWPGFRHFPEWNLRFYVRRGEQRGVCFIREFVPQRWVAWMARTLYREPYQSAPMTMQVTEDANTIQAEFTVTWNGRTHRLATMGAKPAMRPGPDSVEHFFKEHSWGFGWTRRGRLQSYRVNHAEWDVYPVRSFTADLDWAALYGDDWQMMNGVEPASVVLAVGSPVSVHFAK